MGWILLITSALQIGYEHFVARPEAEKRAGAERARAEADYQKWLGEYNKFIESPIVGYPQEAIDKAMAGIETAVSKQVAETRPQLLTELSTRGVRGSGISEYPLGKLETQKAETLSSARTTLELQKLLADRQAVLQRETMKQQFLSGGLQTAAQTKALAEAAAAKSATERDLILQQLLTQAGTGLAYGLGGGDTTKKTTGMGMAEIPGVAGTDEWWKQYLAGTLKTPRAGAGAYTG